MKLHLSDEIQIVGGMTLMSQTVLQQNVDTRKSKPTGFWAMIVIRAKIPISPLVAFDMLVVPALIECMCGRSLQWQCLLLLVEENDCKITILKEKQWITAIFDGINGSLNCTRNCDCSTITGPVYLSLTTRSKAVSMQVPTVQGLTSETGEIFATYESPEEVLAFQGHKTSFWIAALEPCTKARYTAN